jgi:Zn finger protein HypA/HybF involved in hydrogenase expression
MTVEDKRYKWKCQNCSWEFAIPYSFVPSLWSQLRGCPKCNGDTRLVQADRNIEELRHTVINEMF